MKISCKKTCGFCACKNNFHNTSLPTLPLETEIPKNEKQKTEIKAVKSLKKSEKSQKLKSKNNLSPIPKRKHLSVIPIKPKKIRKKHHVKPNIRKKPFVKSKTLTKYTCPSICQKVCLKGCPIKCCKPLEHRNRPSPINTIIPPTSCSPECLKQSVTIKQVLGLLIKEKFLSRTATVIAQGAASHYVILNAAIVLLIHLKTQ
ncbi:hypothetical protein HZS_360 [Henneguya salminicola]|nr:hypothetical protein HZS_360 [Henneguya salminicola]